MPFSRSQRSGPLSRRTPAIDSQHLAKYAPLLVKANSVYNCEPTAFLKSAAQAVLPQRITPTATCSPPSAAFLIFHFDCLASAFFFFLLLLSQCFFLFPSAVKWFVLSPRKEKVTCSSPGLSFWSLHVLPGKESISRHSPETCLMGSCSASL